MFASGRESVAKRQHFFNFPHPSLCVFFCLFPTKTLSSLIAFDESSMTTVGFTMSTVPHSVSTIFNADSACSFKHHSSSVYSKQSFYCPLRFGFKVKEGNDKDTQRWVVIGVIIFLQSFDFSLGINISIHVPLRLTVSSVRLKPLAFRTEEKHSEKETLTKNG